MEYAGFDYFIDKFTFDDGEFDQLLEVVNYDGGDDCFKRNALELKIEILKTSVKLTEAVYGIEYIKDFNSYVHDKNTNNKNTEGFVYIAKQTNETCMFKIGHTINIQQRINTMKTGNANIEIILTKKTKDFKILEKYLHKTFRNANIIREWFILNKEDIDYLTNILGFQYLIKEDYKNEN